MSASLPRSLFTVLGASGFIGRAVCDHLRRSGHEVRAVGRHVPHPLGPLGHVIYAIGVTGDFRTRPLDTIDAHVSRLIEVLRMGRFDSLLYLSSTRVYAGASSTDEQATLCVRSGDPESIYDLSKLAGESAVLNSGWPKARIARLSNVFGTEFDGPNFLDGLVRDARAHGHAAIKGHPESAKDYLTVDDVVRMVELIATSGRERMYNIASGRNLSNRQIAHVLRNAAACDVSCTDQAKASVLTPIDIRRLKREFSFQPADPEHQLSAAVKRHFTRSRAA